MGHPHRFIFYFIVGVAFLFPFRLASAETATPLPEIRITPEPRRSPRENHSAFVTVIRPPSGPASGETLSGLLTREAGLTVRELGGPGQVSMVAIRGSSFEQVTVYLDGVRLNTASTGTVDLSTIPLSAVERIEITRSADLSGLGSGAIGGVINIVTRKASPGDRLEATIGGGSFLTGKTSLTYSSETDRANWIAAHTHSQSRGDYPFKESTTTLNGTKTGNGQTFRRIHNDHFAEDFLLKADFKPVTDTTVSVANNLSFIKRNLPGAEEETTQLYPTNPLDAREWQLHNTSHLHFRGDNVTAASLGLESGINNRLSLSDFDDETPAIGAPIHVDTVDNELNPYLKLDWSPPTRFISHFAVIRYDYSRADFRDAANVARHQHGLGVQDEIGLFANRLRLLPAIRYEDASDFSDDVTLKFGVIGALTPTLSLKGNVGTAYRFPNFGELYLPDQGYLRGNPNLAKEESLNWDLGAALNMKRAFLEVAYFQSRIDNSILFVPISAFTIQPVNTFAATVDGVEATASVDPLGFLRLSGNYTFTHARFNQSGLRLPGRPRHKGNLAAAVHQAWPQWNYDATVALQMVDKLPIDTTNKTFINERSTLDLGAAVCYREKYMLTADAKNITNVQVYDARGFPLPRFHFFITLGVKWS